jgi:hypothetical protein
MTAILFDSAKVRKPAKFARGIRTNPPASFEPSQEDRAWAAQAFRDDERVTAEMNATVKGRSVRKPVEPVADDIDSRDWRDYHDWGSRLWATYGSIDFPPDYVTDDDVICVTGCAG